MSMKTKLMEVASMHWKECLLAIILALSISLGSAFKSGRLFHPFLSGDEVYQIPMILHTLNSEFFANDFFIQEHIKIFPQLANLPMRFLIMIFQDPFLAQMVGSVIFFMILIVGMYFLSYFITKNKFVSVLFAIEGAFIRFAMGGIGFGISTGILIPRDIVLAFSPWLILYFLKFYCKPRKMIPLFFLMGILANIHPLSILHLGGMFALALILFTIRKLTPVKRTIMIGIGGGIAFAIGASPYLRFYLASNNILPSLDLIVFRSHHLLTSQFLTSSSNIIAIYLITLLPFILIGILTLKMFEKQFRENKELKKFFALFACGIVVFLLTYLQTIPSIQNLVISLQLVRASVFFYFFLLLPPVLLAGKWIQKDSLTLKIFGTALFALALVPVGVYASPYFDHLWGNPCFSLGESYKEICDLELSTYVNIQEDWPAFIEMATVAKANSLPSAVFLVPPNDFSVFRVYSERSVVTVFKDGTPIVFSKEYAEKWVSTYKQVMEVYESNSTQEFLDLKNSLPFPFDFIVVSKQKNHLEFPIVFENEKYIIYRVSSEE